MNKKHGNDHYWCYPDDNHPNVEVAIWQGPLGNESVIGRANNKYDATLIVNALIAFQEKVSNSNLTKKETVFLEFIKSNGREPYATMAGNALIWNDKSVYTKLMSEFQKIYEN
jgi:hypothetical protein